MRATQLLELPGTILDVPQEIRAHRQSTADYQELQRLSDRYVRFVQAGQYSQALDAARENLKFVNWVVDDKAGATLVSYFAAELAKSGGGTTRREYAAAAKRQAGGPSSGALEPSILLG